MSKKILTKDILEKTDGLSKFSFIVIGIILICLLPMMPIICDVYIQLSNTVPYIKILPVFLIVFFTVLMIGVINSVKRKYNKKLLVRNGNFKICQDTIEDWQYAKWQDKDSLNALIELKLKNYGIILIRGIPVHDVNKNDNVYVVIYNNAKHLDQVFLAKNYKIDTNLRPFLANNDVSQNVISENTSYHRESEIRTESDYENELTYEEELALNEIFELVDNKGDKEILFPLTIQSDIGDKSIKNGDFAIAKDVILDKKIKNTIFISKYYFTLQNHGIVQTNYRSYSKAKPGDGVYVVILKNKNIPRFAYSKNNYVLSDALKPYVGTY